MPESAPLRFRTAATEVDAVMSQVNACQHDLTVAVLDQALDFGDDLLRRPAPQRWADMRDDAVTTIEQATVLHFDEGPLMLVKARDAAEMMNHAERFQLLDESRLVGD